MDVIGRIYSLKLPSVEWGTVNGESITINRVGANLVNAFRDRQLCRENIFDQVSRGVAQLHANGFALSDVDDGEHALLGDLEGEIASHGLILGERMTALPLQKS
jgi:hypothetical protein